MTKAEIAKLLAMVSELDARVVATVQRVEMWAAVLPDHITAELAWDAAAEHYRVSADSLLPAHVVEHAQTILANRAYDVPELSAGDRELCLAAGVPPEEFIERRDEPGWVEHLRAKWQGIES